MPKVLTQAQVDAFERDGCLSPVRAMSAERAQQYRRKFDALEARVPDIKKMSAPTGATSCWWRCCRPGPARPAFASPP